MPATFTRLLCLVLLAHSIATPLLADPEEDRHTAARLAAVEKKINRSPFQTCLQRFMKIAAVPTLIAGYFLIPRKHTPENKPWAVMMEADKNTEYIIVLDQWREAGMSLEETRALLEDLKKHKDDREMVTRLLLAESMLEDAYNIPREKAIRLAAEGVRNGKPVQQIVDEHEKSLDK